MNKTEFVAAVAKESKATQTDVKKFLEASIDTIIKAVAKGDKVEFVGFGSFTKKLQKGRSGTVPGSTKKYSTKDKNVPSFKAGKAFKERVAKGK